MASVTESTKDIDLATAFDRWKSAVESGLRGTTFENKLITRTFEGVSLQPLYTKNDLLAVPHLANRPGVAPFLRGKRGGPVAWEFCQESTARTPKAFNQVLLSDLMGGQNSVAVTPDVATRMGLDPDCASAGTVGTDGMSVADLTDLEQALDGVALDCVPLHIYAGSDARPLAALYLALLEKRGLRMEAVSGGLTADPLGEWMQAGRLRESPEVCFRALAEWTRFASDNVPQLYTIGVSAVQWGDAGASAVQELAFAIATGVDTLRALDRHGVGVTIAAIRMRFSFSVGAQFFTEVAKLRAFRLLWSRVLAAYDRPTLAACAMVHTRTGRWNKARLDPHTNMLRITTEACSAVLGGVDSLHIGMFDELSGDGGDFSRRIARNLHTLLSDEFFFSATADPAGGSWYVERLSDDVARKAWELFQEIERRGGMTDALRAGYPQKLVVETATEKGDAVATRRIGLVGTNLFPELRGAPLEPPSFDQVAFQAERAQVVCSRRAAAPDRIESIADSITAAKAGATIGQLAAALSSRTVGDEIVRIKARRGALGFEAVRLAVEMLAVKTGARPAAFVARVGPSAQHEARAEFVRGLFAVSGFEVESGPSHPTGEEAARAALASGRSIVVLCSSDDVYPDLVPVFARTIKAARADVFVFLAGLPADPMRLALFRDAGIDEFMHLRSDIPGLFVSLLERIGVVV